MDEKAENTAESKSRKPEDSFPKRSILEYQLSWMHCLLLCEYLDVRGRLFVSMPGLIKWDLLFLADRWSGCYTQTFDWPLAFGHSNMPLQHQVPVSHWQPGMGTALGDWRGGRCPCNESLFPTPPSLHMPSIYSMNQEKISQGPFLWDQVRQ